MVSNYRLNKILDDVDTNFTKYEVSFIFKGLIR